MTMLVVDRLEMVDVDQQQAGPHALTRAQNFRFQLFQKGAAAVGTGERIAGGDLLQCALSCLVTRHIADRADDAARLAPFIDNRACHHLTPFHRTDG